MAGYNAMISLGAAGLAATPADATGERAPKEPHHEPQTETRPAGVPAHRRTSRP